MEYSWLQTLMHFMQNSVSARIPGLQSLWIMRIHQYFNVLHWSLSNSMIETWISFYFFSKYRKKKIFLLILSIVSPINSVSLAHWLAVAFHCFKQNFFPSHTWVIWNWIWDLLYAGHVFFHCAVVSSYGPRSVKWCCMHETLLDWGHLLPAWQQRSFVWREGVKFLIPSRRSLLSKQIAPTICLAGASK